ncbi:hypothetical protein WA026_016041 [Henosepilachna vigintioctopunctata]|uniref:Transposase n=1 Tax=Henosepilachna vigintioctopunctata TaxID=420089 RepID=A0AAW1U8T5_9CUCU
MKVIRKIKKVTPMDYECEDENNNKSSNISSKLTFLDDIRNELGFFHLAVRPLLAAGHESELVYFMQSMGLIQQFMNCNNCEKSMKWGPSRTIDLYHWKCPKCNTKMSIRENSPFTEVKCSFKKILLILLSWCNSDDIDNTAEILDVKKTIIAGLYHLAGKTAEKYIKSNIAQWQIGGPGVIVLVDTFPEGCTSDTRFSNRPILCLAELKNKPPTLWFQALERNTRNQLETRRLNQIKCLEVIQLIVHHESIVVARRNSTLCSYEDLKQIENKFKLVVSNEGLSRHDSQDQRLFDNLTVIWREALDVCMAAQYYHHSLVQSFLFGYMWRKRFKQESYHYLLNEISSVVE